MNLHPATEKTGFAGGQVLPQSSFMAVPVFWRNDQFRQTLPQRLLARPSENGGCLSVPISDDARGVDGDQRIQSGFHDRPVALLALKQRRLGSARPRAFLLDLLVF